IKQAKVTFNTAASQFAVDNISYTAPDADWYKITVSSQALQVTTRTPSDGPFEFANTLNPQLQFATASGSISNGTVLGDGRNESFTAFGLTPGATYYVRIGGQGGTTGEYVLAINQGPVAANDTATTNEDTPVNINVTTNDTDDVAVSSGTVTITGFPQHG